MSDWTVSFWMLLFFDNIFWYKSVFIPLSLSAFYLIFKRTILFATCIWKELQLKENIDRKIQAFYLENYKNYVLLPRIHFIFALLCSYFSIQSFFNLDVNLYPNFFKLFFLNLGFSSVSIETVCPLKKWQASNIGGFCWLPQCWKIISYQHIAYQECKHCTLLLLLLVMCCHKVC